MVGAALPVCVGACSRIRWARRLAAFALAVLGSMVLAPATAFADVQAVGGSAFGEQTDVLAGAVTSGPLPSATLPDGGGGPVTASAASSCVPADLCGVLRTGALSVSTRGSAGGSDGVRGDAQVADVDVAAGVVTGDLVRSRCAGGAGGLSGAATLTNVRVGGRTVAGDPPRNTVIHVGDAARVTLNEQISSAGSITVNAVHVQLLRGNAGDVILPQAHCDVTASPVVPDQTPLALLLPLTTMAVLMGLVILVWRSDPGLFRDGAW